MALAKLIKTSAMVGGNAYGTEPAFPTCLGYFVQCYWKIS